jgi:hypothetical protein
MFSGEFFAEIKNNVGSRVVDSNERYQLSNSFFLLGYSYRVKILSRKRVVDHL